MASLKIVPKDGIYQRLEGMLSVAMDLPLGISDDEVEGVLNFLPPDTSRSIGALLNPRHRDTALTFIKILGGWLLEARAAREEGRKVILIPFSFPPEVIYIFKNAVPLIGEGLTTFGVATLEGQGDRYWDYALGLGIPDHLCSSSVIESGSILSGREFLPDALVTATPGACDANAKMYEFVSLCMDIPQFLIEKPTDVTSRGREAYHRYFLRFIQQMEEFLGEELDEEYMRDILEQSNKAVDLYYELYDLHKFSPCPVPNLFSLFVYGARFTVWGRPGAVDAMQAMIELSRQRLERKEYPAPEEVARCIGMYTSYYFDILGFYNWMEEQGISYLQDAFSLCNPHHIDISSKESMLHGLADEAFDYTMTRQMGADSVSMAWLDDICHAILDLNANCAIYSGHHACKQTQSVINMVRGEIMKRTGAPVLCLQGDNWIRRMTPMSAIQEEIASFVDNVVVKKRRRTQRKTESTE